VALCGWYHARRPPGTRPPLVDSRSR
jgi:hypothetical protein